MPNPVDYSESTYSLYQNEAYIVDGLSTLPADKDAASVQWGGTWRMPTMAEWGELINNCDWVKEGNGFRVYNHNDHSKSIYLPTTGYKGVDKGVVTTMNSGYCFYWTSNLVTSVQYHGSNAYSFVGGPNNDYKSIVAYSRYNGIPIRPVKAK